MEFKFCTVGIQSKSTISMDLEVQFYDFIEMTFSFFLNIARILFFMEIIIENQYAHIPGEPEKSSQF